MRRAYGYCTAGLTLLVAGCGYVVRTGPQHPGRLALQLGVVTVVDPDAVLVTEARATLLRAFMAARAPDASNASAVDVDVRVPVDDSPPSMLTSTVRGAAAVEARALVSLRATWTESGARREVTVDDVAETPVGTDARSLGEASHLARSAALTRAAERLADRLLDASER